MLIPFNVPPSIDRHLSTSLSFLQCRSCRTVQFDLVRSRLPLRIPQKSSQTPALIFTLLHLSLPAMILPHQRTALSSLTQTMSRHHPFHLLALLPRTQVRRRLLGMTMVAVHPSLVEPKIWLMISRLDV